jgi:hypothetical protein
MNPRPDAAKWSNHDNQPSKAKPSPFIESENGSTAAERRASKTVVLQSPGVANGESSEDVPTETPPPYFPQNPLSPGDERTARKLKLTFYGCAVLLALGLVAMVVAVVYLIRSLL